MMTTTRAIRGEVQTLLDYLIQAEIALYANPLAEYSGTLTWPLDEVGEFLPNRGSPASTDYRHWLASNQYSAVLSDGALLQLSYGVEGRELTSHRLAYVPSPFEFDPMLLATEPLVDLFDAHADGHTSTVVMKTTVRFDFDRSAAREGHPASHLTINVPSCRVACAAPLRVGQFVSFIFRHFYPELWHAHPFFDGLPKAGWGDKTVTDSEMRGVHLMWPT